MPGIRRIAATSLVLTCLLTACSQSPNHTTPQTPPPPAPASGATSIKLLGWPDSTLDAVINAFQEKYPAYRVERVNIKFPADGHFLDYIQSQIAAGVADVVPVYDAAPLVKVNLVLPLDAFAAKSNLDLKPYGPGLETIRTQGQLYGLPWQIHPDVLVYNPDLFQAAGVPLPRAGWTWDDLRTAAAKLTRGEGQAKVWGLAPAVPEALLRTYMQHGTNSQLVPDADLRAALQYFSTLVVTDHSMPPAPKRELTIINDDERFFRGQAAMTVASLGAMRFSKEWSTVKWDVAPLPVHPGEEHSPLARADVLGIASTSQHPDAAWALLRFLAGPEGAPLLAKQGILPLYASPDVPAAWRQQEPPPPPGTAAIVRTTYALEGDDPTLKRERLNAETTKQFARMSAAINAVVAGETDWEAAAQDYLDAQQQLRRLLVP